MSNVIYVYIIFKNLKILNLDLLYYIIETLGDFAFLKRFLIDVHIYILFSSNSEHFVIFKNPIGIYIHMY